jgi:hypothetical protein
MKIVECQDCPFEALAKDEREALAIAKHHPHPVRIGPISKEDAAYYFEPYLEENQRSINTELLCDGV